MDDDREIDVPVPEVLSGKLRALRLAVIVMGVLLVAGFVLIFSVIGYRAVKLAAGSDDQSGAAAPAKVPAELDVPAGTKIVSTTLDGHRMALTLEGPGGSEVVVINVNTGAILRRVRLKGQ